MTILLIVAATLAGTSMVSFFRGTGDATAPGIAATVFTVVFLFLTFATYQSIRSLFRVRVLPYFERPLGQKDTWLLGENYLRHSRQLDEIATRIGVRPLSDFASGDELIRGEVSLWFSAEDALKTIERLLQVDISATLPTAVVSSAQNIHRKCCLVN
jgi:hypothetical protein